MGPVGGRIGYTGVVLKHPAVLLLFPLLIALSARVDLPVPGSPVPVSLQTLTIVLAGLLLGPWRGTATVGIYLALGALGLPVLADGAAGIEVMTGPSVGYLVGFPLCALIAGLGRGGLWPEVVAGVIGQGVVLALGVAGLVLFFGLGPGDAFVDGARPFLPGMVAKALVAAGLSLAWRRWRAR